MCFPMLVSLTVRTQVLMLLGSHLLALARMRHVRKLVLTSSTSRR
jgi:hypothetical protein